MSMYSESHNPKVLVVDDMPANLEILCSYLGSAGYEVIAAQDGQKGFEIAVKSSPDLILLDVLMPGINGFETCRRLKADSHTVDIPVLFLTSLTDKQLNIKGFEVGGVDYITKPVRVDEVLARVKTHTNLSIAKKQLALQNKKLQHEIAVRQQVEEELRLAQTQLELRVAQRTKDLADAIILLKNEAEERRHAQGHVELIKNRLQAVFDGISEPLILVDCNMVIQTLNHAALHYFRKASFSDIIGESCRDTFENSNESCQECQIIEAVSLSETTVCIRQGLMDPERVESITVFPVTEGNGEQSGAVIRISDITEKKAMEKNLFRSQKLESIGVLSSGIAHEINNPNNFIMFNVDILRQYLGAILPLVKGNSELGENITVLDMSLTEFEKDFFDLIDSIELGSERIKNIVSELKEFSYLGAQEENTWQTPNLVIAHAVRIAQIHLKKNVDTVIQEIPQDLPETLFEAKGLEQVITNMLINASQAVADRVNSWVSLKAYVDNKDEPQLVIEISDNGCGMDEAVMKKMFDPFFTTKSVGNGTGLGLYVCHNLIDKMGGLIDASSQIGKGSTFKISLPCRKGDMQS